MIRPRDPCCPRPVDSPFSEPPALPSIGLGPNLPRESAASGLPGTSPGHTFVRVVGPSRPSIAEVGAETAPTGGRMDEEQAMVFISCGQNRSSDELATAQAIAAALQSEGFATYIAVEQQTLAGVRDNIFNRLRDAEYYVFIDFMRERLLDSPEPEHRGSLFTHQELALASYLEKDVVAFQEKGVRPLDGLIAFLQANCKTFSDRSALPDLVLAEVCSRGWNPAAHNRLRFELPEPPFMDLTMSDDPAKRQGRFFHLRVVNGHPTRAALDCYAYLDRVVECGTGRPVEYETAELRWAGYVLPNAVIAPRSYRLLAAFYVAHDDPAVPQFQMFTISGRFRPWFRGPGSWDLSYRVMCQSLPGSTATYRMTLSSDLNEVRLTRL